MINFFFENVDAFQVLEQTQIWLRNLILEEGKKVGKINYIFCDDDYLLNINRSYLEHDDLTDIITFDYVKGQTISGDIFVSLPRIFDNVKIHSSDLDEEFHRVLAHGLLHLAGYKDKSDEEVVMMRSKEEHYLQKRRNI